MRVPHLNRKLVLEAPVRAADGAGGFTQSWQALGVHYAEVIARTGREKAGVAVPLSRVAYRIVVRAGLVGASSRPLPEQRFRDGARVFNILAVAEADPLGRYLTCTAEEETVT